MSEIKINSVLSNDLNKLNTSAQHIGKNKPATVSSDLKTLATAKAFGDQSKELHALLIEYGNFLMKDIEDVRRMMEVKEQLDKSNAAKISK